MIKSLFLFLFFSLTLNAHLIINDEIKKYDHFHIQYLYDESSSISIQTIQNKKFTQEINNQFTQGYKYGDAWFKLEFINKSQNENFVLNFTEQIWSTLNLYSKQNDKWKIEKNGLNVPLNERDIQNSTPAFNIHINSGETAVFYVKGNTIASQIGEFQLFTKKEFYNPSRVTLLEWYMIYIFVLFAFILLNLYNYIITKESIYAYYIGYVFIYIVFTTMHSGSYITLGFPNWQEGLHVLGQLTLFSLLLFSIEFLELKTTYPLMKRIFNYLAIGSLIFALLLSQDIPYSTVASNVFFSTVLIVIVSVAIKILRDGFTGAMYYLIALMLYLPSMAMMAMNFNTMLPNTDLTRYSFLAGAFVEIFLFTLILTNRYKEVNKTNILLDKKTKELQEAKRQLTIEATTDMLSGLYNRRYFFEASQKSFYTATRYNQELSILMVDIDKFKNINDSYGHPFGDKVIRLLSNILKNAVRDSDILARYGGEEFIILLAQTNQEDAYQLAERIRLEVQNTQISLENKDTVNITVSLGLTQLNNENDLDIEDSILRCDKALYTAKNSGRNRVSIL